MFILLRTPLLLALLSASLSVPSAADDTATSSGPPPATLDGTVKITGGVVAAGIGYKWGHRTLSFQGQKYRFCVRGLAIGDAGIVSIDAQGNVYNLKSLDDFAGKYFALSGGFAIAKGESAAILKNKRGVMMELGHTSCAASIPAISWSSTMTKRSRRR
jgi:hypothetical protein